MDASTAQAVVEIATNGNGGNDPVFLFMKWAVAVLLVALLGAKPLMAYIRQKHGDDAGNSKDKAEGVLYTHLAEQVREYRQLADKAFDERNKLLIRVTEMESKIQQFEETQQRFASIQRRIEQKDALIAQLVGQGAEERTKFMAILEAKDTRYVELERRYVELEGRVTRDEESMRNAVCPLQNRPVSVLLPDGTTPHD